MSESTATSPVRVPKAIGDFHWTKVLLYQVLLLAAILGAALIGIERELSPGEPSSTDVYDRQLPKLPPDWASATALFESGTLMHDILPAPLRESLIACKRQELETFALQVSDFELETYLESV